MLIGTLGFCGVVGLGFWLGVGLLMLNVGVLPCGGFRVLPCGGFKGGGLWFLRMLTRHGLIYIIYVPVYIYHIC